MSNTSRRYGVSLFVALVLLTLPLVSAQGSGINYSYGDGIASLTTDAIKVQVTALNQVPHFHWWNVTHPGNNYHLMFLKFIEFQDLDGDGLFNPRSDRIAGSPYVLPSQEWEFSGYDVVEEDSVLQSVDFNFTTVENYSATNSTTPPQGAPPIRIDFDVEIQIQVNIDINNPNEVKFGVSLSGWEWVYNDSFLAFQFVVGQSAHGQDQSISNPQQFGQNNNRFSFGPSYIEFSEEAFSDNTTITVRGSGGTGMGGESGQSIFLTFEHFENGNLDYDPLIGMSGASTSTTPTTPDGGYNIDYRQLALLVGVSSIIVLALIFVRNGKK